MFFKNVLVPYDESEHALSALHIAFGMVGGDPEATIHVVTVVAAGPLASPTLSSDAFDAPDNLARSSNPMASWGPRSTACAPRSSTWSMTRATMPHARS